MTVQTNPLSFVYQTVESLLNQRLPVDELKFKNELKEFVSKVIELGGDRLTSPELKNRDKVEEMVNELFDECFFACTKTNCENLINSPLFKKCVEHRDVNQLDLQFIRDFIVPSQMKEYGEGTKKPEIINWLVHFNAVIRNPEDLYIYCLN